MPNDKNIGFNGAARWTVFEKSNDATVDLKRRDVKQPPLEVIDDGLPESLTVKRAVSEAADGQYGKARFKVSYVPNESRTLERHASSKR
ncbi:unnamed protein product [Microthlaspi erraticum]|uniref:Uncharacterized protein n=1 Tax=Microthlaspi erraticum TaxID=1685480 RepID=A0A6D2J5Z1_9BRAS|nr:unnamed protein product [Microthlaspi erraticum]